MAEAFLPDLVEFLLEKIKSISFEEIVLTWGINKELTKLSSRLNSLSSSLKDLDMQLRGDERLIRDLVDLLKDVLYDAHDLVDEFQYKALQRTTTTNVCKLYFFPISRFVMARKLKIVRERLDFVCKLMNIIFSFLEPIRGEPIRGEHMHLMKKSRVRTSPFVSLSSVIGRDHDINTIVHLLLNKGVNDEGENISVISILGMGGVGKTTLAKSVFNDERVKSHFDLRIWVNPSEDFDIAKLSKDICNQAGRRYPDLDDLSSSGIYMQRVLHNKKFLLVLDDVWNTDWHKWNALRELLSVEGAVGSIIITTRSSLAASVMGTVIAYNLKCLSDEESMSLFVKLAFDEGEEKHHPNLIHIANKIVGMCRGLPLALKSLGCLLYMTQDECDWEFVRNNKIWKQDEGIVPALRLSYDQLTSYLKHCFAFCSLFPKDYEYSSLDLIQMWSALGFIKAPRREGIQVMEEIGKQYVEELISRSFFQIVELRDSYITFKVHDAIHDLAMFVGQSEFLAIDYFSQNISRTVRHVSFCDTDLSWDEVPTSLHDLDKLHTVMFPGGGGGEGEGSTRQSFVEKCISRFKYVRVLDLSYSNFEVLPSFIGNLMHMRFLSFSGNRSIKKLPNSICKLLLLQTLQLSGCSNLEELPRDIGNLISLRFLSVTTKQSSLAIGCLKNLRFLSIADCTYLESLGEGMETLTHLQTLWIKDCPKLKSLPRCLQNITTLGELKINGCSILSRRCQPAGEDWPIVNHVLNVTLDDQKIDVARNENRCT